ncbi:hypothetical protein BD311DRAFT_720749 [Dichomitus squalens]|uniref:BTB domain-containing protein n=1 Tax=Dichomitus squalens TaxID=114155 RepID=A0A4Q9MNL9_9APHY|nr:hypothetical protein BD311DRAFT_720749 [Dichomitus squalens]
MSADASPSRKRQRVLADDGNACNSFARKDAEVWLSDGSVVIIAEHVAFRVHKSTLALRSEVFRNIFSLPDAAPAAETFEGCPVVHVSDSHEDIRHLFLVICCGTNYYYSRDELVSIPFSVLASLLRMAHKYNIQAVLEDALFRLKKFYTNDLVAWLDPAARARYVTSDNQEDPITAVGLAMLTSTQSILPTAFLASTDLADVYWETNDGKPPTMMMSALAAPQQARLVAAREKLARACAKRTIQILSAVPSRCCVRLVSCAGVRRAAVANIAVDRETFAGTFPAADAFKPLHEEFWGEAYWRRLCGHCKTASAKADKRERRELWLQLPGYFELEMDEGNWPTSMDAVRL